MESFLLPFIRKTQLCFVNQYRIWMGIFVLLNFISTTLLAQIKLWDKVYGGSEYENLYALAATADGGYLLGGRWLPS